MPIVKGNKIGWNGQKEVGPDRVITWKGNSGKNEFVVVGHDASRGRASGADKDEHYLATHNGGKPARSGCSGTSCTVQ